MKRKTAGRKANVRSARVVYTARKFTVESRPIVGTDGRTHPFDVIVHPGAAVVLPILPDGRILLTRVVRHSIEEELLELPAGTLDPPESPLTCARRELTEETGYRARTMTPLVTFYPSPGILTERMYAFVARGLTPGGASPEPSEFIRPAPLRLEAALRAIRRGDIIDGKTIVALLYYYRFAGGRAGRRARR